MANEMVKVLIPVLLFGALMFWVGYDWGCIREFRRETDRQRAAHERWRERNLPDATQGLADSHLVE